MSFTAINWTYTNHDVIYAKPRLTKTDLAVLRALCWLCKTDDHVPGEVVCNPGVSKLAKLTGFKVGAVNAAKQRLMTAGLIDWERAANFGEHRETNKYRINCPSIEKELNRNKAVRDRKEYERRRDAGEEFPDFDESYNPPVQAGFFFNRPDATTLINAFDTKLNSKEADWMADSLEVICDRPENRQLLYGILRKSKKLAPLRAALDRVRRRAQKSVIKDRAKYLAKALHKALPPTDPAEQPQPTES